MRADRSPALAAMWARCVRRGCPERDAEAMGSLVALSESMEIEPVREWFDERLMFRLGMVRFGGPDGLDLTLTTDAARILALRDGAQ